jgi:hypothetical protein
MLQPTVRFLFLFLSGYALFPGSSAEAQSRPTFEIELEAGLVWQTRNNIQIPNNRSGTRFSLLDLAGEGPWPAGRLFLTWNINGRHGLRVLLAPLSITKTGFLAGPVSFSGSDFQAGVPVEGTYRFNSWRISYRYRFLERQALNLWIGFSAKLRDAKIELRQGATTARDTDLGFVPLLHLSADWGISGGGHLMFDFDGLAGGPGRAFDIALKLGHDFRELEDHRRVPNP